MKTKAKLTLSSTPAGTTMGRKDKECGQMGVTMMAGTDGWIMLAPAATAYAVLPVGVDTIRPAIILYINTIPIRLCPLQLIVILQPIKSLHIYHILNI